MEALSGTLQIGLATGAGIFAFVIGGVAILATIGAEDRAKVLTLARHPVRSIFSEEEPEADET